MGAGGGGRDETPRRGYLHPHPKKNEVMEEEMCRYTKVSSPVFFFFFFFFF